MIFLNKRKPYQALWLLCLAAIIFGCEGKKDDPSPVVQTTEPERQEAEQEPLADTAGADNAASANSNTAPLTSTVGPMGKLKGPLPAFGVYVAEINPANYQKIDTAVMQGMGMEPHYVHFLSGAKSFREGNYDQAIAEYTKAINLKNDYAEAYNYRGYLYGEKGDLDRAIADYTRAIALRSGYTDAWINRGYAYGEKGDLDKAIADYTRVIELEPKNASAYNKRGSLYYQKGDDDRAIADFNAAIKLKGDYALAWNNRGHAWYSKGEAEKAAADFAAAERLRR
ncbi:hypothetical protein FACS189476_03450 [Spirochaetia bacterium]|nr:hypothetical protein FACS189476_03450 [Spirochaetia bacterium]